MLPALKYLLTRIGIPMGTCRKPFAPLSNADQKRLDATAEMYLSGKNEAAQKVAKA